MRTLTSCLWFSDRLFYKANVDYVPDVGLFDETKARSTLSCAIKCSEVSCALFSMEPKYVCKLYNQSVANASWIPAPGAIVYFVH